MSAICVHTLFKKCLSCDTTSTVVFSRFIKNSSSHLTALRSSPFVGSSSRSMSGFPNIACARRTFTFSGSVSSFISLWCSSAPIPRPIRNFSALVSASQPSSSANSPSSSAASSPSSSVNSVFE